MSCLVIGCRRRADAGSPFCIMHLIVHLSASLPKQDRQRFWETLNQVLQTLTYEEREIFKLRSGLGDGYVYTQEEVGRIFQVSRYRIRSIQAKAQRKLLHPIRFRALEDFLNIYRFAPPTKYVRLSIQATEQELIKYLQNHPHSVYEIPPREFEKIVAELLHSFGFDVELTQQTRDGGYDIVAFSKDRLGIRTKYIVECKRYGPDKPIRVGLVRALYGVKGKLHADHALLATTSYFTADAENFAKEPTVLNLHLKDFETIQEWLAAYQQGLKGGGVLL